MSEEEIKMKNRCQATVIRYLFNDAKIEKECKKLKIYHKVLSHRPSQFPRDRFIVTVAILAQQLKLRALGIKRERRSLALDFELGK